MCSGREFQVWAAATGKARLPTVASLTRGTTRRLVPAERKFTNANFERYLRRPYDYACKLYLRSKIYLICTSLQTENHASTPPLKFLYRLHALPAAQPTASKHWRQCIDAKPKLKQWRQNTRFPFRAQSHTASHGDRNSHRWNWKPYPRRDNSKLPATNQLQVPDVPRALVKQQH